MHVRAQDNEVISYLIGKVINLRYVLLFVFFLGFVVAAIQIASLKIDNSLEVWFVKDDPVLKKYKKFQRQFGNDEIITVVFQSHESNLSSDNMKLIQQVTSDIEQLPKIKRVLSIVNSSNRQYFLSDDEKTTMLCIQLYQMKNIDMERNKILHDVRDVLDRLFRPLNKKYYLAGLGVVYDALNQISMRDSSLFISLSYLLIILCLSFFIKKIKFILSAISAVLFSVVVTMGLFAFLGKSINMVTMVLPTLIMIFGIADIIHITNKYFEDTKRYSDLSKNEVVVKSISAIVVPCFLTSLTTSIGFASLIITKMQVIQDLGIFASIGIMIAFFSSIIICTVAFSFFTITSSPKAEVKSEGLLERIPRFIFRWKKIILIASLLVTVVFLSGIFKILVDTYSIQFLRPNHPVRKDSDFIEAKFGYYMPIEFTLKGKAGDFLLPRNLHRVEEFQNIIEDEECVDKTFSVPDFMVGSGTFTGGKGFEAALKQIPESDLSNFVNSDFSLLRITGRVKMLSARGFKEVIEDIMRRKNNIFNDNIQVRPDGYLPLYVKMMDYIMTTQMNSFALAFLIIFAIMVLYAGSLKLGLFAILPNLFPLAVTLGIMGWSGIRLDIATVTITAIAIGVVVDDTMHFLHRYKRESITLGVKNALSVTIREVGWPIISTSVILALGFIILMLAQVNSIRYFGILSAVVIISALFGDLFILPSLIATFPKRKKK